MNDEDKLKLARYLYTAWTVGEADDWDEYIAGTVLVDSWLRVAEAAIKALTPEPKLYLP